MDKETFSSYGWIVITVIVIAIMIAFATPFGKFIVEAVQGVLDNFQSTATGKLGASNYSSFVNWN